MAPREYSITKADDTAAEIAQPDIKDWAEGDIEAIPGKTMPGVAVWHEPFYAKLGGWHQFFENRNLLATASLRRVGHWLSLRRHLLRSFAGNLLRSRYHSASFTVNLPSAPVAGWLRWPGSTPRPSAIRLTKAK